MFSLQTTSQILNVRTFAHKMFVWCFHLIRSITGEQSRTDVDKRSASCGDPNNWRARWCLLLTSRLNYLTVSARVSGLNLPIVLSFVPIFIKSFLNFGARNVAACPKGTVHSVFPSECDLVRVEKALEDLDNKSQTWKWLSRSSRSREKQRDGRDIYFIMTNTTDFSNWLGEGK